MAEAALPLPRKTLRVSELTRYLKYVVEQDALLRELSVQGEISNLSKSPGGHVYFTLKDTTSQLPCVLFRREALQQSVQTRDLRPGAYVVAHGYLTLYEPRGTYQLYVERIIPQGEGLQLQRLERLKEQLEREGIFADERKRPLPRFPRKLALITSPGSQAYHDVLHRLRHQYPFVTVVEVGVSVQGDGASDEMAMAIDIVNRLTEVDVILLVRGGGAPEELAAYNEERLARAIFSSRIPVVTGVGHETDYTIADYTADYRAATPSLAAAAAVPDVTSLVQRAGQLHRELSRLMQHRLRSQRREVTDLHRALLRAGPRNRLRVSRQRADELSRALERSMVGHLRAERAHLSALEAQLRALDPLAILQRGYAVVADLNTGKVVSSRGQAPPGRRLRVTVADGEFVVRAEGS